MIQTEKTTHPSLPGFRYSRKIYVRWSDNDMLGHVNNAVYLTYSEQARTDYLGECLNWDWQKDGIILARTELDYQAPIELNDEPWIHVRTFKLGTKSFHMESVITSEKEGQTVVHARIIAILVMLDYQTNETYPIPEEIRKRFVKFEELS